jgi:hypothetical protein
MTITASDVALLEFDEVIAALDDDEPDGAVSFTTGPECPVQFSLPKGWNTMVQDRLGTEVLPDVTIKAGMNEYPMTKDALLDFTSTLSIQREYMMRTPGPLMEPHIEYWVKNTDRDYRFLVKNNVVVAMTRKPTVVPFGNADILQQIAARMVANGLIANPSELRVDYKMQHDLKYTAVRLIVPTPVKVIHSVRDSVMDPDAWSIGVQLHNSLTGYSPMSVSGYLFAWTCTNGATATHLDVAKYNRRTHGQDIVTVMDWLDSAVDGILHDLPAEILAVEKLTEIDLASEMSATLHDVFERLKVPMSARGPILDNVVDSEDSTAYGLMQAITQAANNPDFPDDVKTRILYVGGDMPALLGDRCEACHRLPA